MKTRRDACDPNRLRHLLEDRLDDDDQAELAEHLDGCHNCRKTLDTLAGGSLWWHEARRFLGDHIETKHDPNDALDFLTPSENPDHLGRLGPYEVISVLGRGGMGLVLRAIDPALNRHVAIKVLAPELATSATARRRFAREGRAAAAISHDHIVAIHSVDASGGLPYLVMQLVAGRSLQERIDQTGPLAVAEILRIGMQTASGLAAAHAVGLIHRDIKPSNILLENCVERVKITDFGLARAVDDASLTQSGVVAGTPQYMSPEQARGEPADHRSDLFSLGSVLYAICTGRAPFRADSTPAVLRRVSEDIPRPILELNPEIPAWLERVVTKLHAKNPADRYQSANEVADLLCRCLAHVQAPASVPLPEELTSPEVKRSHRRKLAIAAVIGLMALCGLGAAEATGLTKVITTVVRFTTAQGTLKVTINDPNIKVRVDDKDLVITGAGLEEVRVNAGVHRVVGSKDGKSVEKLVSITRGGIETVEVSLEPDAKLPDPKVTSDETAREKIIALAEVDLNRAKDRLEWSEKMFLKGYVSQGVLTADMLALQKAKFAFDQATRREEVVRYPSGVVLANPLASPEALAKRADYLKETLTKLTLLGSRFKAAVESKEADPNVYRSGIATQLHELLITFVVLEHEFLDLRPRIEKATANAPKLGLDYAGTLTTISGLDAQFVLIHQDLQTLLDQASHNAASKPGIDEIDAIVQVMKTPKTAQMPPYESMFGSIQRLRKHAGKTDPALDAMLLQLIKVEQEHPETKESEWHKLVGLRAELRQREEAQAAFEKLRQRALPKQDDAAKAKQLQLRFDAYRKGLGESVTKDKNDPVITALREEIARLQTELNSLRVKSNSNDKPIVLDPPDKPKKP